MTILSFFLTVACLYDYRGRRIPNWLIAVIFFAGAGVRCYRQGIPDCLVGLLQMLLVVAILYPLFKIGVLGAGDVKLFGVCTEYFVLHKVLFFLFLSFLIAAFFSLLKLLKERNAIERFSYFFAYLLDVCREGKWHLYIENEQAGGKAGICLSGPILCSVLLCMGGVY